MNKKVSSIILFFIAITFILNPVSIISAESEYLEKWEDSRFEFGGQVFVLGEESLSNFFNTEERENFSLFFAERELSDTEELYYSEENIEYLEQYKGQTLSYDEIIELTENFTLITIQAQRPFDRDTSDQRARVDITEVVSINEGKIMIDITDHYFLISEKQLIFGDSMRVIPEGNSMISYILPELETEYINVEMRSLLENRFLSQIVTIKNK